MPRTPASRSASSAKSSAVDRGRKFELPPELKKPMTSTKCRLSYVHLLEPWTGDPDKPARYSVQCIFDKGDPWIKEAKKRSQELAIEAFGSNAPKLFRGGRLKQPFRDGDDEDSELYAGKIFFNANGPYEGRKPPGVVDPHMRDIREMESPEDLCYSGMYARVSVTFLPYDQAGGRGVRCALNHVQFWEHGEPLAGGPAVDSVFDVIEGVDDPFKGTENDFDDDDWEL